MSLISIIQKYNAFQDNFGRNNLVDFTTDSLFAKNFSKTANGITLAESSSTLLKQLEETKNNAGSWTIEEIEIQPFLNDKSRGFNHYRLVSEKLGSFVIMAIVSVNNDNLIEKINEVYYQIN